MAFKITLIMIVSLVLISGGSVFSQKLRIERKQIYYPDIGYVNVPSRYPDTVIRYSTGTYMCVVYNRQGKGVVELYNNDTLTKRQEYLEGAELMKKHEDVVDPITGNEISVYTEYYQPIKK